MIITCASLLIVLILGAPIAFALAFVAISVLYLSDVSMLVPAQRFYQGVNSFPFLAVPLFILAGSIMNHSGISQRLVEFAGAVVGQLKGGLAGVNVVTSMFFAGMSGTSMADTAAVGSIMIPAMVKRGYDRAFSAAVTAASSTIGIIIPPSLPMVVLSAYMGISTGALFAAGLIPGLALGLGLIFGGFLISWYKDYPTEDRFSFGRFLKKFVAAAPPLLMPVIILGGILGGVFTATEAAAVACVYGFLISIFLLRSMNFRKIVTVMTETASLTGATMFVTSTAHILGYAFTIERYAADLTANIGTTDLSSVGVLVLLSLIMIILGVFLDGFAMMFIVVPLFLPAALSVGIDPLHFAMVVIVCWGIGQQTPPVAAALFITSLIAKVDVFSITKNNLIFILIMVLVLFAVILWPEYLVYPLPEAAGLT